MAHFYSAVDTTNVPEVTGTAKTKKYLWIQQALCFGGIETVIDLEVDGLSWDDEKFNHIIDVSTDGGVANVNATAAGIPLTNTFTNVSYLTGFFDLNRDDPNYQGVPEVAAYVRGNKVHTVTETLGVYALSPTKVFSTNPAYVLLDYMTRPKQLGGCGYAVGDIYLKSFYDAAQICDVVVETAVPVKGRINGIKPVAEGVTPPIVTRDIKLYECNITIDTAETRRDNIERLLETMSQSELIWSEGQYKLVLEYPVSKAAQDALVTATYTDADIIDSEISIAWAGVQDRFNRATVKFLNEEQDYTTDSVSFPDYSSAQHLSYLADDNGIENEIEYFIHGATHRKSALAKAEELVRNSRISKVVDFEVDRAALVHEQGDLIKINSESAGITNEVYRIEEINITSNLSVKLSAVRFDYQTLAYNVADTYVTNPKVVLASGVPNVTALAWNAGARVGGLSNGWLSWINPDDNSIKRYVVYYRPVAGEYTPIGETNTNYFDIPAQLNDGTDYYFLVRTESTSGRLSSGAVILLDVMTNLVPLVGATATVGSNSVTLNWSDPAAELALRYDIYQSTVDSRVSATKVASTKSDSIIISPLAVDDYYFWVDVVGIDGAVAQMSLSVPVSALNLGIKTGDFPAFDTLEQFMVDSVFLQAVANTATSELELATYSAGGIDVSTARISADAILLDGTVTAAKMNVTELSAISASIGTLSSAPSGERVVIQDDKISVYDASNVLRVRIGNLV